MGEFSSNFGLFHSLDMEVRFDDLANPRAACVIPDTGMRAMSLDQLERILRHAAIRLESETWWGWGGQQLDLGAISLYDLNSYVILPATLSAQCSMMELMAGREQQPDYFVSQ